MNPRLIAEQIEKEREVLNGPGERYFGYAVMGVSFQSGHVLALRRWPASSFGEGYTAVWVYDPSDRWTFYQDVPPEFGCSRYFSKAVSRVVQSPIEIEWLGSHRFVVRVPEAKLRWEMSLRETWITRAINTAGKLLPDSFWRSESAMNTMGKAANILLKTGKLTLTGQVPNGQKFIANPRLIWLISQSTAMLDDKDLGDMRRLDGQTKVGQFQIPQRGLFVIGNTTMEKFDPSRHAAVVLRKEFPAA
jgi:hypothetical protein